MDLLTRIFVADPKQRISLLGIQVPPPALGTGCFSWTAATCRLRGKSAPTITCTEVSRGFARPFRQQLCCNTCL